MEASHSMEKSNGDLSRHISSLQACLDDKDDKIKKLEAELIKLNALAETFASRLDRAARPIKSAGEVPPSPKGGA